jgi:hypothetical protein
MRAVVQQQLLFQFLQRKVAMPKGRLWVLRSAGLEVGDFERAPERIMTYSAYGSSEEN